MAISQLKSLKKISGGRYKQQGRKKCSSCGFGKSAKLRSYNWQKK